MTNTLHRFGTAESFADDYVIIAIPAKGAKGQGDPMPFLKRFLEIALEYGPVNLGDAMNGGALRPTRHKHALQHFFKRSSKPDFQAVIDGVTKPTTYAAVFDDKEKAEAFTKRIREEDFGLSINISSSLDNALGCCAAAGDLAAQHRLFARFRGHSRQRAEPACADALDDVRPRHDRPGLRQEDDRLGEGGALLARRGGRRARPLLLLRHLQSIARQEDHRRCPHQDLLA